MQKYSSNFVLQTLLVPFFYANGKASSRSKMDGQDIAGGDILLKDGHRIGIRQIVGAISILINHNMMGLAL